MIELISQAIIDEVNAYKTADTTGMYLGSTVMIDTDFNIGKIPSYTLPLIILEIDDAPNSVQLVGGATQMEWNWYLTVYAFEPDPYVASSYGTGLMKIIDDLRQHFTGVNFLAQSFIDIQDNFSFTFVLSGVTKAQEIEKDNKIVIGRKIQFESVAFDNLTQPVTESTSELTTIENAYITANPMILNLPKLGATGQVELTVMADWSISIDQSWLTSDVNSGIEDATLNLTATDNLTGSSRTANITINGSDAATVIVQVVQAG